MQVKKIKIPKSSVLVITKVRKYFYLGAGQLTLIRAFAMQRYVAFMKVLSVGTQNVRHKAHLGAKCRAQSAERKERAQSMRTQSEHGAQSVGAQNAGGAKCA